MQGALLHGAVPKTHDWLREMNVADWAKNPEGTGPPTGTPGSEVEVGAGVVAVDVGAGTEAVVGVPV